MTIATEAVLLVQQIFAMEERPKIVAAMIPEDCAKAAVVPERLDRDAARLELHHPRRPRRKKHLAAVTVASPAARHFRWTAFHSSDARSVQRLTHSNGATLDSPRHRFPSFDKYDGRRSKMKHPDLTAPLDSDAWVEPMLANGNVTLVDARHRDSTDDDCADHDHRHTPLCCGVDTNRNTSVASKKHRNVALADGVDREEISWK